MLGPADLIRATHIAASLVPAGAYLFAILIAGPSARALPGGAEPLAALRAWMVRLMRWALPVAVVSGGLWLCLEALSMSGRPFRAAMTPEILGTVLFSTLFGRLWMLRAVVMAGLAIWLFRPGAPKDGRAHDLIGLALAGAVAVTLAWVGHAAALEGSAGATLLTAQIAHLIATAAWFGALPPLAFVLARARRIPATLGFAAAATRRFSPLGIVSVTTLILSGLVNSWFLVGSIPALFGTAYGHLLLIKLGLVLGMLALAAVNRFRLTPDLALRPAGAVRGLVQTVGLEIALGLGVLLVVGALGATPPGAHEAPVWPFSFAVTMDAVAPDGRLDLTAVLAVLAIGVGAAVFVIGAFYKSPVAAVLGLIVAVGAAGSQLDKMIVPATPTSFVPSPVGFTADAVARGGQLYAAHCAACHGASGHGDGAAGVSLVAHLLVHPAGELFWRIGHGFPGTPMPGFAAQIAPDDIWRLVHYLRAQAEAAQAGLFMAMPMPEARASAPDFTAEIDRHVETLGEQRGKSNVLLVICTWPGSRARLIQLAAARAALAAHGLHVLVIPADEVTPPQSAGLGAFVARPAPAIVAAYSLYGPPRGTVAHEEFLIDRAGEIRGRWAPADGAGWDDLAALEAQVDTLNREPFRSAEPARHGHH